MDNLEGALNQLLTRYLPVASGYSSDSRHIRPGNIFIALPGTQNNGDEFVPQALQKGAMVAVVTRGYKFPEDVTAAVKNSYSDRLVECDDLAAAHRYLAKHFRSRFKGIVIGVGGSAGKTTTKDFIYTLLAEKFRVCRTARSQNGELGIPKTLEKLTSAEQIAVIEIGIDAPGDMARHVAVVQPDIAVLTSIGEEHLQLLQNVENVFREEKILFEATLARGGVCFAPDSDLWLATLGGVAGVTLVDEWKKSDAISLTSWVALRNVGLAVAVARHLGLDDIEIGRGLKCLTLPEGRGEERRIRADLLVIADHYNANPMSVKAALAHASGLAAAQRLPLRLVLGDMLDLGAWTAAAHEGLVADIIAAKPTTLWLVGPEMSKLHDRFSGVVEKLRRFPSAKDGIGEISELMATPGVLLLKGSRGMGLECLMNFEGVGLA